MLNTPFSVWPSFSDEEVQAVADTVRSNKVNYWTGQEARHFEREFAEWVGVPYAIALANGTVALDVALKVLGIGPGDEVIVTPRTFIASISCVVNAGAIPVFADVDADSGNISPATIAQVITPRTRAVICVHLGGWPCDMDGIMALADQHGFKVIEDCAQAHGARYKGRSVGSIGHIGAWSFCQDKIMTTGGEGGMVTTHDESLWRAMWAFKDHGKSYAAVYEREHPPGFRWLHETFGTNWRMLEVQAVIGRIQLRRMADWSRTRRTYLERIWAAARAHSGLRVPEFRCGSACSVGSSACAIVSACKHAGYRAYVYVIPEKLKPGWSRDRIQEAISARGVPCFTGSCSEVYLEKAFDGTGWRPESRLPNTRALGDDALAFLIHPTLTAVEIDMTCAAINAVMIEASA
jgi:dTDP-4-amino-4,6-dideoxygalactose transaminase